MIKNNDNLSIYKNRSSETIESEDYNFYYFNESLILAQDERWRRA